MNSNSIQRGLWTCVLSALGLISLGHIPAEACCPFHEAGAQTFADDIASVDVAVLVKLTHIPKPDPNNTDLVQAQFEITEIIKGAKSAKVGTKVDLPHFSDGKLGSTFLVFGVAGMQTRWSTPTLLTSRAKEYLQKVITLPKDGDERYVFFQKYLEDDDPNLARDAFDEFAKADYAKIKSLKPHLNHDRLVTWIKDPNIPTARRRFYYVLLGVCGTEADVPMLEATMRSTNFRDRGAFDALIACYLTLKGDSGLQIVEENYLKNQKSDFTDTYAVVMALRFHATEGGVLKRERIAQGMKHMLKRPELADLIIPDLAAWEDWSATEELFELFKTADEKNSWVRLPVINFLRRCPTARAKELLKECERIDPAAVKRANTFFPGDPAPPIDANKATSAFRSTHIRLARGCWAFRQGELA